MSVAGDPRQSREDAQTAFVREHPGYAGTVSLDEVRETEFARLDDGGHVYLDYTGGGLYARSQLREHVRLLEAGVYGNPHSVNPTSAASTELVERARASVLRFFRASPQDYVAIFTPNATGALRLVGEAYPFHCGDRFLLSASARTTSGNSRSPASLAASLTAWPQVGGRDNTRETTRFGQPDSRRLACTGRGGGCQSAIVVPTVLITNASGNRVAR
jgi:hypothetical protein